MLRSYCLQLFTITAFLYSSFLSAYAQDGKYPDRDGPRPETTSTVPHVQIGAVVKPELYAELLRRVANIPYVEIRETVISLPGAKGFWLLESLPLERPNVIVGGREFAHIHPDGSLHASLKPADAVDAIEAGWAIAHPWSNERAGWEGFVMIYSPTNQLEVDMVYRLVSDAFEYVTGLNISNEEQ